MEYALNLGQGWTIDMFVTLLLAIVGQGTPESATAEPAVTLPVENLVVYRGTTSWVRREGRVRLRQDFGQFLLDATALPESLRVLTTPNLAWSATPHGPLAFIEPSLWERRFVGARLRVSRRAVGPGAPTGPIVGYVRAFRPLETGKSPVLSLESERGLELLSASEITGLNFAERPSIRLTGKGDDVQVATQALVAGIGWRAVYFLDLGPDGKGKLTLSAVIRNATDSPLRCERGELSLATLELGAREVSDDGILLAPIAIGLEPGQEQRVSVWEMDANLEELSEWNVGGTTRRGEPVADELIESIVRLTNPAKTTMPPGEVVLNRSGRPIAVRSIPRIPVGGSAEVRLGVTPAIEVSRQEVEIERKKAVIRGENDPQDFVQFAGSLTLVNHQPRAVKVRVTKTFEGDGLSASDEGITVRAPNRVGKEFPSGEFRWTISIPAGQTKRLTYGFQQVMSAQ